MVVVRPTRPCGSSGSSRCEGGVQQQLIRSSQSARERCRHWDSSDCVAKKFTLSIALRLLPLLPSLPPFSSHTLSRLPTPRNAGLHPPLTGLLHSTLPLPAAAPAVPCMCSGGFASCKHLSPPPERC